MKPDRTRHYRYTYFNYSINQYQIGYCGIVDELDDVQDWKTRVKSFQRMSEKKIDEDFKRRMAFEGIKSYNKR